MIPTHYFESSHGHRFEGVPIAPSFGGGWLFLCICSDGITWMKEPVMAYGIHPIEVNKEKADAVSEMQ